MVLNDRLTIVLDDVTANWKSINPIDIKKSTTFSVIEKDVTPLLGRRDGMFLALSDARLENGVISIDVTIEFSSGKYNK